MISILAILVVSFGGLVAFWIVAENRGSKSKRIALGLLSILLSLPVGVVISVALTQLDDQSYYAAAVRILLDESLAALEAQEPGFAARLRDFRTSQRLSYETRGDLLENVRRFHDEGVRRREARPAP
ncbi:MAG TPA: hypothetical protein P5204_03380 [Kiritimatiellia bacterium]|jgi:hypothetical protein|nr:hypothetical protein [Kiritimatiellia bacterium]